MNPYRSRGPNSAINRIAVALVVLIALGAILASILLGPKPNATIVMMQPIRPAETTSELPNVLATPSRDAPTNAAPSSDTGPSSDTAPSSDPLASVPTDQLPVIQSRPAQAITSEPANIEQSELGVDVPAADSSAMSDGSSATASSGSSAATSSEPDAAVQSAPATTVQNVTPQTQTNSVPAISSQATSTQASDTQTKPATVTASSNTQSTVSSSAVRPVQTIKPDSAPSSATTASVPITTNSSVPSTTTASVKSTTVASAQNPSSSTSSATPRKAFMRRATNGVSVQVVALSNLNAAAKLAQNLAANGFTANVQPSGSVYRVVIGPYASETAAQTAATRATGFFR